MALAKTRLSGAQYVARGYAQVEPNHLSARRNGQIYAQLPANANITVLENGQFVKYDYAAHEVNFTGKGAWMLVFNEIKVYRDFQGDADFAMIKDNYEYSVFDALGSANYTHLYGESETTGHTAGLARTGEKMVPRVFKISVGDIYTTNAINEKVSDIAGGDILTVGTNGWLVKAGNSSTDVSKLNGPVFQVVQVYVMPDLQPGVKLQCIAE